MPSHRFVAHRRLTIPRALPALLIGWFFVAAVPTVGQELTYWGNQGWSQDSSGIKGGSESSD